MGEVFGKETSLSSPVLLSAFPAEAVAVLDIWCSLRAHFIRILQSLDADGLRVLHVWLPSCPLLTEAFWRPCLPFPQGLQP